MSLADKIKKEVSLLDYLERHSQGQYNGSHFNPCPFCGHKDCFSIDKDNPHLFQCFSCEAKGSVIDLHMHLCQISSAGEAIKNLAEEYKLAGNDNGKSSSHRRDPRQQNTALWIYKTKSTQPTEQQALAYLDGRGIGAAGLSSFKAATLHYNSHNGSDRLIAPVLCLSVLANGDYEVSSIFRSIQMLPPGGRGKKWNLKGHPVKGGILPVFHKHDGPVILVESVANALCVHTAGFSSLCLYSANFTAAVLPELKKYMPGQKFILCLDKGAEAIQAANCKKYGLCGLWFDKDKPKGYDLNDLYRDCIKEGGLDAFKAEMAKMEANARPDCPYDLPKKTDKQEKGGGGEKIPPLSWLRYTEEGKPYIITGLCALAFWNKQAGNLICAQKSFWRYSGGCWRQTNDDVIRAEIQKMMEDGDTSVVKSSYINDVYNQIVNKAVYALHSIADFAFDAHKTFICLQNGVLDTESMEMLPHCREFYQSIQLPFSYSPEATALEWARFLTELEFQPDTLDRLQEWAGYCLVPDTRIEMCLFLHGEGSNGKSTFLETITKMLGDNCSAVEPQELMERFQLLRIRGKLVNCCADISTQKIFSEKFKNIVSGELVESDVKHKNPVTFRPFARHLFSANNLIVTKDRSYGFFRRFDVLHFCKIFDKEVRDEGLKSRIWENELPGVFNWALVGLNRLRRNKWKMTPSAEFTAAHDEFKRESNPVQMFIEECCTLIDWAYLERKEIAVEQWQAYIKDNSVNCRQFREAYVTYCQERGYIPLSDVKLGKEVKRLGFERKRRRIGAQLDWCYFGLKL